MSYESLLLNTCTIKKLIQGPGVDPYGNPDISWDDVLDQACRLSTPTGREIKMGAEVVIADHLLFLEDIDVTEQDRVIMDSVTYEILLVARRQNGVGDHHVEAYLRTVR